MSLPVRSIRLSPSDAEHLAQYPMSDTYVKAILTGNRIRQSVKLRYRGGHTRTYPKKSYELRIGSRSIHYNAEYDDPSMMRNALSFRFFREISVPSPRTRHVRLELNGVPQGVYLEIEGVDRSYFQKRRIPLSALLYAVNNNANFRMKDEHGEKKVKLSRGYEILKGGRSERARISRFVKQLHSLPVKPLLPYLRSRLDIPEYLRWLSGAVCTGNYDGFEQNYALYRTGGSLRYRISPWDYEGTWGRDCYGQLNDRDFVEITGDNGLTEKLLSYKEVRRQYREQLNRVLHTAFTPEALEPVIARMHSRLLPELLADPTRKHSQQTVVSDLHVFYDYIRRRRSYILSRLSRL